MGNLNYFHCFFQAHASNLVMKLQLFIQVCKKKSISSFTYTVRTCSTVKSISCGHSDNTIQYPQQTVLPVLLS